MKQFLVENDNEDLTFLTNAIDMNINDRLSLVSRTVMSLWNVHSFKFKRLQTLHIIFRQDLQRTSTLVPNMSINPINFCLESSFP